MLLQVFRWLSTVKDKIAFSGVCKRLRYVAQDDREGPFRVWLIRFDKLQSVRDLKRFCNNVKKVTEITGEVEDMPKMRKLKHLYLSGCENLSELGLKKFILATDGTLRSLDLRSTQITINVFNDEQVLSRLTQLQSLDFEDNDNNKMELQQKLPNAHIW